jgi:hypothetical protein
MVIAVSVVVPKLDRLACSIPTRAISATFAASWHQASPQRQARPRVSIDDPHVVSRVGLVPVER